MKSKLITFLMIISTLAALSLELSVNVCADINSPKCERGIVSYDNTANDSAAVIIAQYNDDKSLKDVKIYNLSKNEHFEEDLRGCNAKVMVWDSVDKANPLSDAVEVNAIDIDKTKNYIELNAAGYDNEYYTAAQDAFEHMISSDGGIRFYDNSEKTGRSSEYLLSKDFKLYVNNIEVPYDTDYSVNNSIEKFIFNNTAGSILFVDDSKKSGGNFDKKYDEIYVTYYGTAIVKSAAANKIYFDKYDPIIGISEIDLNNKNCSFTMNGHQAAYEDIKRGDVLSIAADPRTDFKDSGFYDIRISRNTVVGKVIEMDARLALIGIESADSSNKNYPLISGLTADKADDYTWDISDIYNTLGNTCTIYLDSFGRIADYEKIINFAIVHNAYRDVNTGEYNLQIINENGELETRNVSKRMNTSVLYY